MATKLFRCFNSEPLSGITNGDDERIKRGICLLRVGDFVDSNGVPTKITRKMLQEMDANFDYLREHDYLPRIPMRLIHLDKGPNARHMENVAGHVDDVYLSEDGSKLYVDACFTEPRPLEMFNNGTLYNRSAEFGAWKTTDGQVFENVLAGFTWCDLAAIDQLGPPIAASAEDVEIITLTAASEKKSPVRTVTPPADEGAPTPPSEEAPVMKTFTLDHIKSVELKTGEKVVDLDLLELPEPEVFTLEVDGKQLTCMDQLTHDVVTQMVADRDKAQEEAAEAEAKQRESYVDGLKTAGKILGAPEEVTAEQEFVKTLSSDQYAAYVRKMDAQPSLVNLDSHGGAQDGGEGDEDKDELAAHKKYLEELRSANAPMSQIKGVEAHIAELEGDPTK